MARMKKQENAVPTVGDKVAYSWLPEGVEVDSVLAGNFWKPQPGEGRALEINGFQKRDGESGQYLVISATDLKTGEQFSFAPGGLFEYLTSDERGADKIKTGDRVGMLYKGEKKLANGYKANDWEIVRLK